MRKDESLNKLIAKYGVNVAQFVSFSPDLDTRYVWVRGHEPNDTSISFDEAIRLVLGTSPQVNVRSFKPGMSQGCEFIMGLTSATEVKATVQRLADNGFYTIVNESIDVNDGGVSGVFYGGWEGFAEFAPGDTPRCVEKPGVARFNGTEAQSFFKAVYNTYVCCAASLRIEFSLHPVPRGYLNRPAIYWEVEEVGEVETPQRPFNEWPNRLSEMMGDKAYGLYVASCYTNVPRTMVIPRKLPAFSFGLNTGEIGGVWYRTCPKQQVPGKYSTIHGQCDPFALMAQEDPTGENIASMIIQDGVSASYSGAAMHTATGLVIEGVEGYGEGFMQGADAPQELPEEVLQEIRKYAEILKNVLGPVRFEWVFSDTYLLHVVQLHVIPSPSPSDCIVEGDADDYEIFDVTDGLEVLRKIVEEIPAGHGVKVRGRVGLTSHVCDILRKAGVPSSFEIKET